MNIIQENLLCILNNFISENLLDAHLLNKHDSQIWKNLYKISKQQAVTAIVFEKLSEAIDNQPSFPKPSREIILKWYTHSLSIEKKMKSIRHRSEVFAHIMLENGLKTLVLKGIAISGYYPNPLHREFGDLDCYLYEQTDKNILWKHAYEKGNVVAEKALAVVHRGHYKHSHITYQKLTIENHQFCLPIRGSKKTKELERHLRTILERQMPMENYPKETNLLYPPADFNALFLIAHAMNHFLYESIKMRHVLDWALFIKAEYKHVDWKMFWKWCDKMHYSRFVECIHWICEQKLGMDKEVMQIVKAGHVSTFDVEKWGQRVLDDIFVGDSVYNKGNTALIVRLNLAKNFLQSAWKYQYIAQKNFIFDLARQASAMIWDKNPKL